MQQFNTDLKAQAAIIGHAIFQGGKVAQYLRPGIDDIAANFANWKSGAGIVTTRGAAGARQVQVIVLYRFAPNSDPTRLAELLQADFADNPTTRAISQMPGLSLSTIVFGSHTIPIPLPDKIADTIYSQLYHQHHDGSTN